MSNERSPNEDHIKRVSDSEELVDLNTAKQPQEEGTSISTLPENEQEKGTKDLAPLDSKTDEDGLSTSHIKEEVISEGGTRDDQEQQIIGLDAAQQQQQQIAPTMSPEQVLLLQVLRRAKRQQELVIEVQKSLKSLTTIQKGIEKTTEQVKQLQSVVKDSQRQITQLQRQLSAVERRQEKEFVKFRTQKRGGGAALIPDRGKAVKNRGKRKKIR
jgi:hypothetical protein